MFLLVDIGNTRIKYAVHDGRDWLFHRVCDEAQQMRLPGGVSWQGALAVSVAASARNEQVAALCAAEGVALAWFASAAVTCGLRNDYENPEQLGADRWAAAVAAWQRVRGSCLVVSAGTATTIDVLGADASFAGGCILPGITLMQRALHTGTARLPLAAGRLQAVPRNTADAIHTGILCAQLGAIERMRGKLPPGAPLLLTGGAAGGLREALEAPVIDAPLLVLEGLLAVLREGA